MNTANDKITASLGDGGYVSLMLTEKELAMAMPVMMMMIPCFKSREFVGSASGGLS